MQFLHCQSAESSNGFVETTHPQLLLIAEQELHFKEEEKLSNSVGSVHLGKQFYFMTIRDILLLPCHWFPIENGLYSRTILTNNYGNDLTARLESDKIKINFTNW